MDTLAGLDPSDPDYQTVTAELDRVLQDALRKVSGIVAYREHCRSMAARADAMQQHFLAARLEWERSEENLETYVKRCMEAWGKKELEGDGLKIKLKSNPPSVVITDENLIPWDYRETVQPPPVEKIVKAKIAKALKAGIDVPGADLNISSTRVDWGDVKPKKKGSFPDAEILPEIE
jgi:hypothetical protein